MLYGLQTTVTGAISCHPRPYEVNWKMLLLLRGRFWVTRIFQMKEIEAQRGKLSCLDSHRHSRDATGQSQVLSYRTNTVLPAGLPLCMTGA